MYANLGVTVIPRHGHGRNSTELAHEVVIAGGKAIVHLDDPTDESSYAAPKGEREVDLSRNNIRVVANF